VNTIFETGNGSGDRGHRDLRSPDRSSQGVGLAAAEDSGLEVVLDATRQLLEITTPEQAADVARNLITALGGQLVPAAGAPGRETLPVDVSFGYGVPLVPLAPPLSVARLLLERHLPSFMLEAQRALARVDRLCRPAGVALPAHPDLEAVLGGLAQNVTSLLGLSGSGITMAADGRLHFATAGSDASAELARDHDRQHPCLCRDACATGEVVRVTDMRLESTRWPEFSATATRLGVTGVAAVPLRLTDQCIGSLNLYSTAPRAWSDEDIDLAELLADVATRHLVNASRHCRQDQLAEQLQEALESRIVIARAKEIISDQHGITLDQAFQRVRRHARSKHTSLRIVAEAIVALGLRV